MPRKRDKGAAKTNAARALDQLGIAYTLRVYPVGDAHLSAAEVAAAVGLPPQRVFKTLVVRGDQTGPLFVVVPSTAEVDLKAAARASGNRRLELVPLKEVTVVTGYVRGGTTVLAARKSLMVLLDDGARDLPSIVVSAGQRGLQLELAPLDYVRATGAMLVPVGTMSRRP